MKLLAALAAALIRPDVSESRCVTCGALVTAHFDWRMRWTGCTVAEQPQSQPQQFVRLPRLLQFPAQRREVHARSVAPHGSPKATAKS